YVRLEGAWILDVGCGIGTYVQRFAELTAHPYGIDVSLERLRQARAKGLTRVLAAAGERLPFSDRSFDVVVFNEVIEHVADDRQAIADALRVLRPGGHVVIYAPNRLFPFETHGVYWRGRYVFWHIPAVKLLPNHMPNRLVPPARAYPTRRSTRLFLVRPCPPIEPP